MSTRFQISSRPTIRYKPHIEEASLKRMEIQSKINGEPVDFTYRVRDYGRLPLWIVDFLEKFQTLPGGWRVVREKYALDDFFIAYKPPRDGYIDWTLTNELPRIGVIDVGKGKSRGRGKRRKKFFLGLIGEEIFEAVQNSQNWLISFENLVLLRLLAHKLESLGITLSAIHKYSKVNCTSTNWPSFEFSWSELSTCLWDVFLVTRKNLMWFQNVGVLMPPKCYLGLYTMKVI